MTVLCGFYARLSYFHGFFARIISVKTFSSPTQKTGEIGENIACTYLLRHGFAIVERNYTKKWGEIDIVAKKDGIIHFIEVKSISHETKGYRPEEQVHFLKRGRLARTIETYVASHAGTNDWKFDLACVYIDKINRKARMKFLEDLIL